MIVGWTFHCAKREKVCVCVCRISFLNKNSLFFSPFKPWWCWWRWKFWSIFWFWCVYTSQWLYSNHFLPAYYKHMRAIFISHRVPHWPRFQRPVNADAYTFPFHFLTFLISPFSPFAGSLFPLHFSLFHFRPRASLPPSPSCVWGSSIGYTGLEQYFSFSKKSAVEAHESPLKDVHRLTGGIHPPTPLWSYATRTPAA